MTANQAVKNAVVADEASPTSASPSLASTLDRWTDTAPNWGDAPLWANGPGCTVGFPLHDNTGHPLMLTAAHCLAKTPVGDDPTADVRVGVVAKNFVKAKWDSRDLAVIDLKGQSVAAARTWFGDAKGNANLTYMTVRGVVGNHVNDYVCTNGGYSGTRCGLIVDAVDQIVASGYGGVTYQSVEAHSWDGSNAGGHGDSGTGVFSVDPDLQGVRARHPDQHVRVASRVRGLHRSPQVGPGRPVLLQAHLLHGHRRLAEAQLGLGDHRPLTAAGTSACTWL
ncbi:hypothetical protein [Streptomyces sp. NPDC002952]|uniref:hypothetical protein n=1 Tax=Streptomyces sp. NPDC002952 TaxID=3364673 RepID=UPI0036986937